MCCYRVWQVLTPKELDLPVVFRLWKKHSLVYNWNKSSEECISPLIYFLLQSSWMLTTHSDESYTFLKTSCHRCFHVFTWRCWDIRDRAWLSPGFYQTLSASSVSFSSFVSSLPFFFITSWKGNNVFVLINMGCILITVHLRTVAVLVMVGSLRLRWTDIFLDGFIDLLSLAMQKGDQNVARM